MKTSVTKPKHIYRAWHLIDLSQQPLGRAASQAAQLLIGKHKPYLTPHLDCGDYVVAINAQELITTGRKKESKLYRHHTGHPGGFREVPLATVFAKNPKKVVRQAIVGMLPKNKLRDPRLKRLKIFLDAKHPYQAKINTGK